MTREETLREVETAQTRCDKRYVRKDWFWRSIAWGAVALVASAFAAGLWYQDINQKVRLNSEAVVNTSHRLEELEIRMIPKIDSTLQLLKGRRAEAKP